MAGSARPPTTPDIYLLACVTVQGSVDLLLDEVQVLGEHQAVLLHHRLQVVVLHQVVEHGEGGRLMLQWKRTCYTVTVSGPQFENESMIMTQWSNRKC